MEVVWAKAAPGIWGLGHVFEGQLYFARDIVDSSMLKDLYKLPRPKAPPPSPPKPAPKPAPKKGKGKKPRAKKGEHVQLFRARYKKGKGFYTESLV